MGRKGRRILLVVSLSSCLGGGAALNGHPYSFEGSPSTGWAIEYGDGGFGDGTHFGFGGGGGRMYLMEDWQVGDWGSASYKRFNLLGKTLRYTVDLSNVGCGVLATLYLTAMPDPGPGPNYCDIQPGSGGCLEVDIMEANAYAFQSTLHTHGGFEFDGSCNCNGCAANVGRFPYTIERPHIPTASLYGPGADVIDTRHPFEVVVATGEDGAMDLTMHQRGKVLALYNRTSAWNFPKIETADVNDKAAYPMAGGIPAVDLKPTRAGFEKGLTLITSMWTPGDSAWLDMSGCIGEQKNGLGAAHFAVSGLTVSPTPVPAAPAASKATSGDSRTTVLSSAVDGRMPGEPTEGMGSFSGEELVVLGDGAANTSASKAANGEAFANGSYPTELSYETDRSIGKSEMVGGLVEDGRSRGVSAIAVLAASCLALASLALAGVAVVRRRHGTANLGLLVGSSHVDEEDFQAETEFTSWVPPDFDNQVLEL